MYVESQLKVNPVRSTGVTSADMASMFEQFVQQQQETAPAAHQFDRREALVLARAQTQAAQDVSRRIAAAQLESALREKEASLAEQQEAAEAARVAEEQAAAAERERKRAADAAEAAGSAESLEAPEPPKSPESPGSMAADRPGGHV